jgi:RES domain-containing protein
MIERLLTRFQIRRVIVAADRGMVPKDSSQLLTNHPEAPFDYILGCRLRRQKEVNEQVLARAGTSPVLVVPSALVPHENLFLLNPLHLDFSRTRVGPASPFAFGPRLLKTG